MPEWFCLALLALGGVLSILFFVAFLIVAVAYWEFVITILILIVLAGELH